MTRHQFFIAFAGLLVLEIFVVDAYAWHDRSSQRYFPGYPFQQQLQQSNRFGQLSNVELVQGTIDQLNQINANWVCTNPKTGDQLIIGTDNGNTVNNNAFQERNIPVRGHSQWNVQQPYNLGQQVPGYNLQGQIPEYNSRGQVPGYNIQQQLPEYNNQGQVPGYNNQVQVPGYNNQGQIPGYNPQPQVPGNNPQPQVPGNNPQLQVAGNNPQGQVSGYNSSQTKQSQNLISMTTPAVIEQERVATTTVQSMIDESKDKFSNFDWTSYVTKKPVISTVESTTNIEFDGQGILEARTYD